MNEDINTINYLKSINRVKLITWKEQKVMISILVYPRGKQTIGKKVNYEVKQH